MEALKNQVQYLKNLVTKKNYSISPSDLCYSLLSALEDVVKTIAPLVTHETTVNVKYKKNHTLSVLPKYAREGDAGMDLTVVEVNETPNYFECDFKFSMEIPRGYVGLIFPRSSICNFDLYLTNCVGVIDSGYRGNITARFKKTGKNIYKPGDRAAQLVILPHPNIVLTETDSLSDSERNAGGHGSTGG